jgi:hypothetical protein
MEIYVQVPVEYAHYYNQMERTLLGTDIGRHCLSTSVDRVSTFGRTLDNTDRETTSYNTTVSKNYLYLELLNILY